MKTEFALGAGEVAAALWRICKCVRRGAGARGQRDGAARSLGAALQTSGGSQHGTARQSGRVLPLAAPACVRVTGGSAPHAI